MNVIYKVWSDYDNKIKVAKAQVISETPGRIKLSGNHGAFGYAKHLNKSEHDICRTPGEAIDQFIADRNDMISDLKQQITKLENEIEQAQALRREHEA